MNFKEILAIIGEILVIGIPLLLLITGAYACTSNILYAIGIGS